jgi:hypothetical protein
MTKNGLTLMKFEKIHLDYCIKTEGSLVFVIIFKILIFGYERGSIMVFSCFSYLFYTPWSFFTGSR